MLTWFLELESPQQMAVVLLLFLVALAILTVRARAQRGGR